MNHVAVEVIQEGGRKDTLIVGGDATWSQLRAVFNQVDGLIVISPDTDEPSGETTLAALADRKSVVCAGPVRLEFAGATGAMLALAMQERRPEPTSYALSAMPDITAFKDFQVQELPDHQPRFNSRDFRRQAKTRPPKVR
jgi:hypothetical protein